MLKFISVEVVNKYYDSTEYDNLYNCTWMIYFLRNTYKDEDDKKAQQLYSKYFMGNEKYKNLSIDQKKDFIDNNIAIQKEHIREYLLNSRFKVKVENWTFDV